MLGYLFAIIVAISYGTSSFYMKAGMKKASGDVGVFYTLVLNAFLALLLAIFVILQTPPLFNRMGIIILVVSGLLGPALGRMTLYRSIKNIGVTRAATIKNGAPVFSALIAYLILGETLSFTAIIGIGVVIFGLYLLTNEKKEDLEVDLKSKDTIKQGIIFGLIAALFFAFGNVFRKLGLEYINSAILALFISTTGSLVFYFFYFTIKGKLGELIIKDTEAKRNFVLGGIYTCIATLAYFLSLKTTPVAIAVTLANTEPIFTILLGTYVFKEADEGINRKLLINIGITFLGVLMITLL